MSFDRPRSWAPVTGEPRLSWEAQFFHRVLQDAYAEAAAAYWIRRAETFAAVRTPACDEIATACRNRASLGDVSREEFNQVLRDLAGAAA